MDSQQISKLKSVLTRFYTADGPEQVGFIVGSQIISVPNVVTDAEHGFIIAPVDIVEFADRADATWHTHPGHPSNLGGADHDMFKEWSKLYHFIVGSDGVRCYKMDHERKAVMEIK